jgi:transcriptional regulator with XRE-family HTH domain
MAGKTGSRTSFRISKKLRSDDVNAAVAKNFCILRERSGLSQKKVGELAGCSGSQINKFESGENVPHAGQFKTLAKIYKCSESDFFKGLPETGGENVVYINRGVQRAVDHAFTPEGRKLNLLVAKMPPAKRKTVIALAKELGQ